MPADGKMCSFNCIYCECGFNEDHRPTLPRPTREEVSQHLEQKLQEMVADGQLPDVLTFAGNGEPTLHPHFPEIIEGTIALRDKYFPNAKVSVLTNATQIHKKPVFDALCKVDNNICKLDTISADYIGLVDRPNGAYEVEKIIEHLKEFGNRCIIQTMFMKGEHKGHSVDNTSETFVQPWLKTVGEIRPREVMIYTIDRETPAHGLKKAEPAVLDAIGKQVEQLGIQCKVAY
jgi:wyosine [tRNA(Phe)-imidazoG37] synthetase (radical SAM superfamily)